jgi:anti-sigma B factor antagonist
MNVAKKSLDSGIVVLELAGMATMGQDCERLDHEILTLLEKKNNRVILDFGGVSHIDSAVLGKIIACHSKLKKAGGGLRVAGPKGAVENLIKTTNINRIVGLYPSVDQAAADFAAAETAKHK